MSQTFIALGMGLAMITVTACGSPESPISDRDQTYSQVNAGPTSAIEDSLFILWEYGGALRERELANRVLEKSTDSDIRALATLVRDGHQAGMDAMRRPAKALGLELPHEPTAADRMAIEAAARLPSQEFDAFFLRRQRAMHAWDVTVFDDFREAASNPELRAYVEATREPLRRHAAIVDRLARAKGVTRPHD